MKLKQIKIRTANLKLKLGMQSRYFFQDHPKLDSLKNI